MSECNDQLMLNKASCTGFFVPEPDSDYCELHQSQFYYLPDRNEDNCFFTNALQEELGHWDEDAETCYVSLGWEDGKNKCGDPNYPVPRMW